MSELDFERSLAVVIGIDRYSQGIAPLQTAVLDATAIANLLSADHGYSTTLITDQDATNHNLTTLFYQTLPQAIKPNDRLLFYFAGHGIALNGEDGPEGFLIPQDARLGDIQTYLSMVKLQQALSDLPCRHFLAFFDCCFSGAFRWSSTRDISVVPEVIHQERYERFLIDPAWQVITSTAYDQTALDAFTFQDARGQQGKHSPFALALLEALAGEADALPPATSRQPKGDGIITATELYLYLRDRIEPATHQADRRQTPSLFPLGKHDKGEYIFFTPNHPLNLPPAPPLDRTQNPYRGLESFDEEHADLFFGRSDRITELKQQVIGHPLTVVIGPSGSGKSSLVKAGLLPQLRSDSTWQVVGPFRPSAEPLEVLSEIVREISNSEILNSEISGGKESNSPSGLPENGLSVAIKSWQKTHPQQKLLIIIDQLEELLTLGSSETARSHFFRVLANALPHFPTVLRLVFTLRADFEPHFQSSTPLASYWSAARFILPPMSRADLREAIEQPASAKVMYFQSDDARHPLVEQIINETADMPGALPLLSFTLSELYIKFLERQHIAQQHGTTIDRAILEVDYKAIGGVVRSLTQRADQEYDELVQQDAAYAHTIRNVMLRMVAISSGEATRRRVPLFELAYSGAENERAQQVIRAYSTARLLVEGQDLTGQPYVEPAHDALVSGWQRLLTWQREEENLALQRRLTPAALDWQKEQKPRFLWNADPRLELVRQIANAPRHWLNQLETEFVQRSVARKKLNGRLRVGGTLVIISLLSAGLLAALIGQRRSIVEEARFSKESARLNLGQNHSLEGLTYSLLAGDSLQHPLLRWVQPEQALQNQVQGTLQWAIFNVKEQNRLTGSSGPVRSQWSPDGTKIVTAGEDGLIQVWDAVKQESIQWQADSQGIRLARFSPNGQWIATAGTGGTVALWTLAGEKLAEFGGHEGIVSYVAFSLDGQWLASIGRNGELFLWDLRQGQDPLELSRSEPWASWQVESDRAKSVYFHPQRPWLITTDLESIKLWSYRGELIRAFEQHAWSAVFTPDGRQIVAAGDDGQVGVWNVETGDRARLWPADRQRLWNLTLSPDGRQIATAGEDGIVKLWTFSGELITQLRNHTGPARSVSFSPDAKQIASAGDDSTTRIWTTQNQALLSIARPTNASKRFRLAIGGTRLVSGSGDGKLLFWPLGSGSRSSLDDQPIRPTEIELPELETRPAIQDIDIDATGNIIVTLSADGSGAIRDLAEPEKATIFRLPDIATTDSIALSPDSNQLALSVQGKDILVIDRTNGQSQTLSSRESIRQLAFSPDGNRLAIASANGLIELWDTRTWQISGRLQEHVGDVNSIAFSPAETSWLASAGTDGTVRLWNTKTNRSIGSPLQVYGQSVVAVRFSPNGETIASGDRTGAIQLWNAAEQDQIAAWQAHPKEVQDIRFSPDGQKLITAGAEGAIDVWALDSFEELMERGCDRIRNFLTAQESRTEDRTQDSLQSIEQSVNNLCQRSPL
ncbi:caspase family protein [cf. Phormidesmis sp. LEGE 11477]|uniref:nSTAND1 domain-containing NTPase n=1 Tax=cf. Phormidesmis sp. LEGE 11477 TaxID=1828680 RepID=UPI00187DE5F7|nr:caspase family protein [cf. Phormidesmis sp. LEGE 11477]MBE9059879.1 caspase family protein [cf. Phormidesmis sp. LEGE 11477]